MQTKYKTYLAALQKAVIAAEEATDAGLPVRFELESRAKLTELQNFLDELRLPIINQLLAKEALEQSDIQQPGKSAETQAAAPIEPIKSKMGKAVNQLESAFRMNIISELDDVSINALLDTQDYQEVQEHDPFLYPQEEVAPSFTPHPVAGEKTFAEIALEGGYRGPDTVIENPHNSSVTILPGYKQNADPGARRDFRTKMNSQPGEEIPPIIQVKPTLKATICMNAAGPTEEELESILRAPRMKKVPTAITPEVIDHIEGEADSGEHTLRASFATPIEEVPADLHEKLGDEPLQEVTNEEIDPVIELTNQIKGLDSKCKSLREAIESRPSVVKLKPAIRSVKSYAEVANPGLKVSTLANDKDTLLSFALITLTHMESALEVLRIELNKAKSGSVKM